MKSTNQCQHQKLQEIASLLEQINPDCGYGKWIAVLMVVFNETHGSEEGFELVDQWSSPGRTYRGTKDVWKYWSRFHLNHKKPLRMGTLIRLARGQ